MQPLISVIIPAYNIENYIERCLKSVREQTYGELEIIVIDDGSTDRTGKIIDSLANDDPRIIPIHKKNAGVSAARNSGLDRATGDYIGFVDGDDIIEKDMYELLISNALKYDADISHCGYQMVFPNRVDYYYNTGEIIIQDKREGIIDLIKADKIEPGLWNKLYSKKVIGEDRLSENIKINEDFLFNYIIFRKSDKSIFEDFPKYHYMVRENSASTSGINMHKLRDPIDVLQFMMKQEQGEVFQLLEKRYLYALEKVSTISAIEKTSELKQFQMQKRQELKDYLKDGKLLGNYSRKNMLQLNLAAKNPIFYRILHNLYACITGSKNKYKL